MMREVFEIKLPICDYDAEMAGIPAEYLERAVRQLGSLVRLEDVALNPAPNTQQKEG